MALLKSGVLFLACIVAVLATPFENCDPTVPALSLDVTGCDQSPCIFVRGQTYGANVTFTVDHEVTGLNASLAILREGAPDEIQYLLPACDNIYSGCPLEPEAIITYGIAITVSGAGYVGRFAGELSLTDEHDHRIVCVSINGVISATQRKPIFI